MGGIGWVCTFLSVLSYTQPRRFAVIYTISALASLASTMFLWGPMRQIKAMFKPIRAVATIIYLSTIILTFYLAFSGAALILILLSILVQSLAMVWYCLSYVPYGRQMAKNCVQTCV